MEAGTTCMRLRKAATAEWNVDFFLLRLHVDYTYMAFIYHASIAKSHKKKPEWCRMFTWKLAFFLFYPATNSYWIKVRNNSCLIQKF